jgi:hypothetical protein
MTNVLALQAPATEKQINLLVKLLAERIEDETQALAAITWVHEHKMSKATASAKITQYMNLPRVRNAFSSTPELDEGMYKVGDDIFKVYTTRETGVLVTKQLVDGYFEYTGQRPLSFITADHRMTLDEAKEYGQVTGTCCVCGRKLTNEASIAEGIGPVCSGKV